MSLEDVKNKAESFKETMQSVEKVKELIRKQIESVEQTYGPLLTTATEAAAQAQNELALAIDSNRDCFVKPKTLNINGLKIGLQQGKTELLVPNEEETIVLIKEKFDKKKCALMIKTEESVIKGAFKNFKDAELEALGITRNAGIDEVYIKVEDSDISKVVTGLLKDTPLKAAA